MEEFKNQIDNMSDDDKNKIILQYLTIRKKANNQYNLTKKDDPEFIKKNRTFAKNYYINNKNKKLEYYEDNKSKIRIRARYNYYKNIRYGRQRQFHVAIPPDREKYYTLWPDLPTWKN